MYLIDTNALSEIIKKKPNPSFMNRLRNTPTDALFSASICIMELRYGALKRGNPADLWTKIEQQILPKIRILSFSYKEAMEAGDLIHHLYSIGQPIGIEDIMIASIALSNGLTVVSANNKHFSRVPRLKNENWFES
ncbi:MAG: type II toxin-antitoxin system VapC family toxin [Deltaproteobacteria bacterium]|nr:type II toxin-antitoxin system VapC family toxin [Deltaproteobacteria bacterium]